MVRKTVEEDSVREFVAVLVVSVALVATAAADAAAAPFTGIVRTVVGSPLVVRGGTVRPATKGTLVEKGDTIRTDAKSTVGLVFSDDTLISLGPRSEVVIDDYLFEPEADRLSFVARVLRGTMNYLSGQIAKLSPKSVRLLMPTATVGVRGTHVLINVK
jgi:hypothetical protein